MAVTDFSGPMLVDDGGQRMIRRRAISGAFPPRFLATVPGHLWSTKKKGVLQKLRRFALTTPLASRRYRPKQTPFSIGLATAKFIFSQSDAVNVPKQTGIPVTLDSLQNC
jgi:hypothetical protein